MSYQIPIVSSAKSKWYKPKKVKKLALNSTLLTVQTLTNDVQVLILCLSYFITTVNRNLYHSVTHFSSNIKVYGLMYFSCGHAPVTPTTSYRDVARGG